ncbi:E3 ubiquitin-protein ligase TRIM9-like [Saccostrea cucullata]|uniref:E3 ubiquitin-protein ligase TRIM9-like n=1 Tax=Saccostrea cuccullata TaxID=36930 RepID=UPI002ED5DA74
MHKSFSTELKLPGCSQCKSNAEYYCRTCEQDLCVPCKEEHVIDFDTKHHDVVIDSLNYGDIMLLETCERHPGMICDMWCLTCNLPLCSDCAGHLIHETQDLKSVYESYREQNQGRILHLKSEIILHNFYIQAEINRDFISCQIEISKIQKSIVFKAERLKHQIKVIIEGIKKMIPYIKSNEKHQRRHIRYLQKHVTRSELSANRAIKFLKVFKKNSAFKINDTPSALIVNVHIPSEEINKDSVLNCLGLIQITESRKREVRNDQLLRVMSPPELKKSFKARPTRALDVILHISCLTRDIAWVSSWYNLKLTDTAGENLFILKDKCKNSGVHTVTREGNLVYIDENFSIKKL